MQQVGPHRYLIVRVNNRAAATREIAYCSRIPKGREPGLGTHVSKDYTNAHLSEMNIRFFVRPVKSNQFIFYRFSFDIAYFGSSGRCATMCFDICLEFTTKARRTSGSPSSLSDSSCSPSGSTSASSDGADVGDGLLTIYLEMNNTLTGIDHDSGEMPPSL